MEDCRVHRRRGGGNELGTRRSRLGCADGDAKLTRGFCLPAKYVIATVGPRIDTTSRSQGGNRVASAVILMSRVSETP